jgi:hypothetical protein
MCESVFSELSFKSPEPESTLWYNSGVKISTPTWSISPSMLFLEQLKPALTIKELEVKEVLRILPLPITNEILEYYI